jgi:4-diphosphocytidyl-2-C-methyl-D-erythritol kinase
MTPTIDLDAGTIRDWPAPAKLNLYLAILGRLPNGYHRLETAFALIDLCDRLDFLRRDDGAILRPAGAEGVAAESDLSVRAARLLQEAAGCPLGVEITVDKHIPMGAGLGGGSSDAAAVLLALNRLWGLNWPLDRLAELGARLGADVPIFVHGRHAWGTGTGTELTPIELPPQRYLVLHPGVPVATAAAYADPALPRNTPSLPVADWLAAPRFANDFEAVVLQRWPEVGEAAAWLRAHTGEAHLSGSGSALFARIAKDAPIPVAPHPHWRLAACHHWAGAAS